MKKGNIIVQKNGSAIKYYVTGFEKYGNVDIVNGIRVKYDKRRNEWVTFGNEKGLLLSRFRLLTTGEE
jgi:hypothetical protein